MQIQHLLANLGVSRKLKNKAHNRPYKVQLFRQERSNFN